MCNSYGQNRKKRAGLKEAIALIQKQNRLRNSILIAIFFCCFLFPFRSFVSALVGGQKPADSVQLFFLV
jgi:hypothetical protein